ncbi:MAG: class II fumarate hydratase [Tissierellia bacterium]|nr:class II fumarate hydratase [Tissierellia bacterium]
MDFRIERDSLGEVRVPKDVYWGPQTQRSHDNFPQNSELMPLELIHALVLVKKACAEVNFEKNLLDKDRSKLIVKACEKILSGELDSHFPLTVWQTGSGTQSNMNVNEVISHYGNEIVGTNLLHPNDHVNMSQSSNDTFPTAIHISAAIAIKNRLIPEIDNAIEVLENLEKENEGIIKIGRTHLQDATPLSFSQEISAWKFMMIKTKSMIEDSMKYLYKLAIGGTAVGTGLNAPKDFGIRVAAKISEYSSLPFESSENKFHSLTSHDAIANAHGALKSLAADLMKMANDIRWLASGPRCGIGEINIPANEPGSSIMPSKVNPTQAESLTMICVQVMSNDIAVGFAASQGNFQLNVFMPLIIYNFLQSVRLLSEGIKHFNSKCLSGLKADRDKMSFNLNNSLMLVTALAPKIGYDNAAKLARYAHSNGITLKKASEELSILTAEEFDKYIKPENMV